MNKKCDIDIRFFCVNFPWNFIWNKLLSEIPIIMGLHAFKWNMLVPCFKQKLTLQSLSFWIYMQSNVICYYNKGWLKFGWAKIEIFFFHESLERVARSGSCFCSDYHSLIYDDLICWNSQHSTIEILWTFPVFLV